MIAGIGLDNESDEKNIRSNKDKIRMGHSCPKTHAKQMGKLWATVACFSAKQSLVFILSESESESIVI
jgi:hypothetical protein